MSRGQKPWQNSDRRKALPSNWPALREDAHTRNPEHVCWRCGVPGGEALDHKDGNRDNNSPSNLDWIHDWRSVKAGIVERNCHAQKTRDQQLSPHRVERHPAFGG